MTKVSRARQAAIRQARNITTEDAKELHCQNPKWFERASGAISALTAQTKKHNRQQWDRST